MRNNWSYKTRLLLYFTAAFTLFAVVIIFLQFRQDRITKQENLHYRLSGYADIISRSGEYALADTLLLPAVRITVIGVNGDVVYDAAGSSLENHSHRPEVRDAMLEGSGYSIRHSATTGKDYFYYAERFGDKIIRVAHPYDDSIRNIYRPNYIFMLLAALLFAITVVLFAFISRYFSRRVSRLLKHHLRNSENGVALFSSDERLEYANPRFLHMASVLSGGAVERGKDLLSAPFFEPLQTFFHSEKDSDSCEFVGERAGRRYRVKMVLYADSGYEINIADITEVQKNVELKQQLTSNVSHELRTPVTSIRGYLETLLSCDGLSAERSKNFLERAYQQTLRLSDLIRDVALISKIEESAELLSRESVNIHSVAVEVFDEQAEMIKRHGIVVENMLQEELVIVANRSLVYAILRNLVENSIRYGGEQITLHIECYMQSEEYLYFTYYDTGRGVANEHLDRLFERFYRVGEGRTREDGGSGLGLSIVRNAIVFHGGEVRVVNRELQGLQFFFSMARN